MTTRKEQETIAEQNRREQLLAELKRDFGQRFGFDVRMVNALARAGFFDGCQTVEEVAAKIRADYQEASNKSTWVPRGIGKKQAPLLKKKLGLE